MTISVLQMMTTSLILVLHIHLSAQTDGEDDAEDHEAGYSDTNSDQDDRVCLSV